MWEVWGSSVFFSSTPSGGGADGQQEQQQSATPTAKPRTPIQIASVSTTPRLSLGTDTSVAKLRGLLTTSVNFRDVSVNLMLTPDAGLQPTPSINSVVSELSEGFDSEALALEMCTFGTGFKKNKLVIIMVGLPARGKTFLCNKILCYLNWCVPLHRTYTSLSLLWICIGYLAASMEASVHAFHLGRPNAVEMKCSNAASAHMRHLGHMWASVPTRHRM